MSVAEKCRTLLSDPSMTEAALAQLLGLSPKELRRVLSGEKPLKKKGLASLAVFTGLSEQELLSDTPAVPAFAGLPGVLSAAGDVPGTEKIPSAEEIPGVGEVPSTEDIPGTKEIPGAEEVPGAEDVPTAQELPKAGNYPYAAAYAQPAEAQTTERFRRFCRTRFHSCQRCLTVLQILIIVFLAIALFGCLTALAGYAQIKPMVPISMFLCTCFIPLLLLSVSVGPLCKLARTCNFRATSYFRFYTAGILLANLLFAGTALYCECSTIPLFLLQLCSVVYPFYLVFIRKQNAETPPRSFALLVLLTGVLSLSGVAAAGYTASKINGDENAHLAFYAAAMLLTLCPLLLGLLVVMLSEGKLGTLRRTARYFDCPAKKRPFFKGKRVVSVLIVVVLSALSAATVYTFSLIILEEAADAITQKVALPQYADYDKADLVFTDADRTKKITLQNISLKIPEELTDSSKNGFLKYANKDESLLVFVRHNSDEFTPSDFDVFSPDKYADKNYSERQLRILPEYKQIITQKYGFYPETLFEYYKLSRAISEAEIDRNNRKELAAHIPLLLMMSVGNPIYNGDTVYYLYETPTLQAKFSHVILNKSADTAPGESFLFECCAPGDSGLTGTIVVRIANGVSADTAYKILNSVEVQKVEEK